MPRPLVRSGFPDAGQIIFPGQAKEAGRNMGLTGKAVLLEEGAIIDAGGAQKKEWNPVGEVRMRIDPVGQASKGVSMLIAESAKEETTHIASFDPGTDITTDHRIELDGKVWLVTTKMERTDPLIERVGVRGV
jgi:hypothetical protein